MRLVSLASMVLIACVLAAPARASGVGEIKAWLDANDPRAPSAIAALVKAEPRNAGARVLLVRLLLRQGKADAAIDIAKAAVGLAPQDPQVHYWLGNAYGMRLGQVGMLSKLAIAPRLRDAFERAVQLDPDLVDARSSLVQFYLQAPAAIGGGLDEARRQAAEIAKRDPARGHVARAQILMREDKPAEALQAYEAAHAAKPGDAGIRLSLGVGYQMAKQWDKAFDHFQAWTHEDPAAGAAWYQLGRGAALSGQHLDEGAAALERYLTLPRGNNDPETQHAYYRLGQVHAHAGDKAKARAALEAALAIDPKLDEARKELARL